MGLSLQRVKTDPHRLFVLVRILPRGVGGIFFAFYNFFILIADTASSKQSRHNPVEL